MAIDDDALAASPSAVKLDIVINLIAAKWAVPVLLVLAAQPVRRKQLKQMLSGINDDRLDAALTRHLRWGLVERSWITGPRADEPGYALTELGESLLRSVGPLARWQSLHEAELLGKRHKWDRAHPAAIR
jgi:DNA-binding HxlR family transcriptional regulator